MENITNKVGFTELHIKNIFYIPWHSKYLSEFQHYVRFGWFRLI